MKNVAFKVVGVLSKKGANMMGMDQDDVVMAPWTTIKYRLSGTTFTNTNQSAAAAAATSVNSLDNLYDTSPAAIYPTLSDTEMADTPQPIRFANVDYISVKAASTEQIPQAIEEITQLLHERHRIKEEQADDFNIRDMSEINNALSSTTQQMSILLLVVAMISLVVGGVGIMNIMLVSVTERTREIGLRMAVGARSYHILRQFLAEAVVLCFCGGAIGILFGRVRLDVRPLFQTLAHGDLPAGDHRGGGGVGRRGRGVRFLSGLEGLAARPDRCLAVRVARQ